MYENHVMNSLTVYTSTHNQDTRPRKDDESKARPGFGTFFRETEEMENGEGSLEFARRLRDEDAVILVAGAPLSEGSTEDDLEANRSREDNSFKDADAFIRERAWTEGEGDKPEPKEESAPKPAGNSGKRRSFLEGVASDWE